jgi:phosphatidylinositol-4,5-bisphosphate 3-kinase
MNTPMLELSTSLHFNTVLQAENSVLLNTLPRESRIAFQLLAKADKDVLLAYAVIQLINERGHLVTGRQTMNLWVLHTKEKGHKKKRDVSGDFIFMAPNRDNLSDERPVTLVVEFDSWELPAVAPLTTSEHRTVDPRVVGTPVQPKTLAKKLSEKLKFLTTDADPLERLADEDKELLWSVRTHLVTFPAALPKFLQSVNWRSTDHRIEAYNLLKQWAPLARPEHALELLDCKYPDYTVRKYAVEQLRQLDDDQVRFYMLQLTQCLKHEPYHDSPLARFLMERSLKSPYVIGHYFFWHLKAELHNPMWTERFALLLEEFLSHCGRYAQELRKQNGAVLKLQKVAEMIVKMKRNGKTDDEAMAAYVDELKRLNKDFFEPAGKFAIPFNPKLEAKRLIIHKCRYMSSKMVPLWLVFENADEESTDPILIIFKSGDDLRQDILTLQMLQVMDKLWLANNLDLKMTPYEVIATGVNEEGEGVGMIQVVPDSDTTSGIQLKYGGGAVGALRMDPIEKFLKTHNEGSHRYDKAVEHFIASCAGYCVATYVLGIGDRHNGNIMVTKDGHLFHIDFGHFLGNFKKKFGVNRERAAFVFTPEMAYVIGGKKYRKSEKFKDFLDLSSAAYKVLRENAPMLEALFMLMVPAGMPELMREEDIYYLREKLMLDVPWAKAEKKLIAEIYNSLETTYRRIDNMIHNFKHG